MLHSAYYTDSESISASTEAEDDMGAWNVKRYFCGSDEVIPGTTVGSRYSLRGSAPVGKAAVR